ncbi:CBS domain-containing protein [Bacillus sp. FJAT-42315]|uniref:CBS domain-containing protein n=1 Tax=Bacillus sp. FJAT-42315 TaxID=2014077 RepID=UPI000C2310F2|nr:CBS domain-containing protein [Bacillus sp. FJAT-42315]
MIEKNERSLRFEVAFNRIHQQLKQLAPKQAQHSFIEILHTCAQQHASVRTHLDELKQFAKLRNAIVHQKTDTHSYIAEPHEEIVKRIEQIDALISKPADALSIASKPVCMVELHTPLAEVLQMMKQFSYSEYPVFTKGVCKGLLTGKDILKWMAHQQIDGSTNLFEVTVQDLLPEQSTSTLAFIKKEANVFDVEYLFEGYQQSNKKLEAILITPNGTSEELPIAMITSWDLTKTNDQII